ncbi:hypothetical protein Zmor_026323 [Zophobas morio]|uniref:Sulfotransferase domain-containing protein n=1 Tax=Zophobas morio TaxID=2755281 RepID=A0AA38HV81_9CUCU|nr:hypothetical protein Zmor_026323 [Zophobas morio]
MVYSVEQNTFIVMSYYRNGTFVDGAWLYSVAACKQEYLANYPDLEIQETSLEAHIRDVINRFVRTGNVNKGKSSGRTAVSEEVVDDLRERLEQNRQTSLTRLSQQSGVPVTTCHKVPERIRAMNASVKLLLIVREPVTRAISDYTQLRANAATASPALPTPPPKSFESLSLFPNGSINEAYRPLAISIYHNYLHRWLEVFSREQILVVNGDLLIEDPVPQIQKIERFLGLEPRIGTHNFYFNETKGFYCLRNETSDRCLRETKGRKHPRVDPNVVSKLRRYFGEHNQKFYELIGEDLGWPEE